MSSIRIIEASIDQAALVAANVKALLIELEPEAKPDIEGIDYSAVTEELMAGGKITPLLAMHGEEAVAVLTLHECAAIYAQGLFGEISELYVSPAYRSQQLGQQLIDAAMEKAASLGWKRLEVGSPPEERWPRSVAFYENNGFSSIGKRLGRSVE